MKLDEAQYLVVTTCFTDPKARGKWAGMDCIIRSVKNGWVLIECEAGWFNIRAKYVEELDDAIKLGWTK